MNFAREGLVFIVGSAVLAAAVILVAVTKRSWPIWLLGFALLVIAIWVASFFRDPERPGARGDQIVISPADGKVVLKDGLLVWKSRDLHLGMNTAIEAANAGEKSSRSNKLSQVLTVSAR